MTARTSQKLADALREAGLEDMARRAEKDEFHDFLGHDAFNSITLANELAKEASNTRYMLKQRRRIAAVRERHLNGDFDADSAESDDWAASPEGQDAFRRLAEGK